MAPYQNWTIQGRPFKRCKQTLSQLDVNEPAWVCAALELVQYLGGDVGALMLGHNLFFTWSYELGKGGTIPWMPNHCEGRRITAGPPKSPNNVTSAFFNTVHLLPKDLSFEHWDTELASCPGVKRNL